LQRPGRETGPFSLGKPDYLYNMITITVSNYIGTGMKLWSVTDERTRVQENVLADDMGEAEDEYIKAHPESIGLDLIVDYIGSK
jgi:hypothetical protein